MLGSEVKLSHAAFLFYFYCIPSIFSKRSYVHLTQNCEQSHILEYVSSKKTTILSNRHKWWRFDELTYLSGSPVALWPYWPSTEAGRWLWGYRRGAWAWPCSNTQQHRWWSHRKSTGYRWQRRTGVSRGPFGWSYLVSTSSTRTPLLLDPDGCL